MKSKLSGKSGRVAIVLPNKLGDAILSLPLVLCLRQLAACFGPLGAVIEVVTYSPLIEVFAAVGITSVTQMTFSTRFKSWLAPPDKAFFLIATSKNFGYYARSMYGRRQRNKLLVQYDHDLKCIGGEPLPDDLTRHLITECHLPRYAVRQFGIALELGYTVEQIISTFAFSRQSLPVDRSQLAAEQTVKEPYLICCMEAAGGKGKHNDPRRWIAGHYLTIANRIREQYGHRIAFVGIATDPSIPAQEGFLDLRGTLSLWQLFQLMSGAAGYFGNDTGPLHVANLVGIPSVGVYISEDHHAPLFSELNSVVMCPASPNDVYPAIQRLMNSQAKS